MFAFNILIIGIGIIIALGGLILLDRQRFDRKPRAQYRAAVLVGALLVAACLAGLI